MCGFKNVFRILTVAVAVSLLYYTPPKEVRHNDNKCRCGSGLVPHTFSLSFVYKELVRYRSEWRVNGSIRAWTTECH